MNIVENASAMKLYYCYLMLLFRFVIGLISIYSNQVCQEIRALSYIKHPNKYADILIN